METRKKLEKPLVKNFTFMQVFHASGKTVGFSRRKWVFSALVAFTNAMRLLTKILVVVSLLMLAGGLFSAELAHDEAAATAGASHVGASEGGHETLPQAAPKIGHIGPIPITSSMVVTWIVAVVIIVFAQIATRNVQQIPSGAQNFWEWLVEGLRNFLEGIIGRDLVQRTFWFFASIFIFILFCNWMSLIPGVGSIGWGEVAADGKLHHITHPLFRGANADLNMTLAMSMVFFVCWTYWAISTNGPGGFILHLFGPKGNTKGLLKVLMIVVFIIVGVLEVVSILFRPVSLSFRLYGNIFAGENIMETMATMNPKIGWLLPIPFYFMELLVGIVQALVFMLLTAVFTLLICQHDESHGHHGHAHGEAAKH
jgi:F-type H+-transporting ATPase subunit a